MKTENHETREQKKLTPEELEAKAKKRAKRLHKRRRRLLAEMKKEREALWKLIRERVEAKLK